MKAVILSAGKGTRLGTITAQQPKPLIRVADKPILQYNVELCRQHNITTLFINTHHQAEKIRTYFGDGSRFGVSITYSYEKELLGTAGALLNFRDRLQDGPFFVIYGDNITDFDLTEIANAHSLRKGIATVALFHKTDVSMNGIAMVDSDMKIRRFIEKPSKEEQTSNLVSAGIYILEPAVFSYVKAHADFGKDVFPAMISNEENLYGILMQGKIIAVDTAELLHQAEENRGAQE